MSIGINPLQQDHSYEIRVINQPHTPVKYDFICFGKKISSEIQNEQVQEIETFSTNFFSKNTKFSLVLPKGTIFIKAKLYNQQGISNFESHLFGPFHQARDLELKSNQLAYDLGYLTAHKFRQGQLNSDLSPSSLLRL